MCPEQPNTADAPSMLDVEAYKDWWSDKAEEYQPDDEGYEQLRRDRQAADQLHEETTLSQREAEVAVLLGHGYDAEDIQHTLSIAHSTAYSYVYRVQDKLREAQATVRLVEPLVADD